MDGVAGGCRSRGLLVVGAAVATLVVTLSLLTFVAPTRAHAADGDFQTATGVECLINRVPGNTLKMRCNYGGSDVNRIDLYNAVETYTGSAGLVVTCSPDSGGLMCASASSYSSNPHPMSNPGTFVTTGIFDMELKSAGVCTDGRTVDVGASCAYPQPSVGWRTMYCGLSCWVDAYPAAFPPEEMVCVDEGDCTTPTTTTTTTTSTTTRPIATTPGSTCAEGTTLSVEETAHVLVTQAASMGLGTLRDIDVAWMVAIAMSESGLRVTPDPPGDGGNSYGLWQVNSPAHPEYDTSRLHDDPYYQAFAALEIAGIWEEYGVDDNTAVYHPWTVYWSRDGGATSVGDGNGIASDAVPFVLGVLEGDYADADPGCGGISTGQDSDCGSWTHLVCHIKKAMRESLVFLFVPSDSSMTSLHSTVNTASTKAPISFLTEVVDSGAAIADIPGEVIASSEDCVPFYPEGGFGDTAMELCFHEQADALIGSQLRLVFGVAVYFAAMLAFGFGAMRKVNASG